MATYGVSWTGLDAGREGLWKPAILLGVLRLIQAHEGEKVYEADSPIYAELEAGFPGELWRADDNGRFRPLFRDYPHPWTRTGLARFDTTFGVTARGAGLLSGQVSLRDVYLQTMRSFTTDEGERPFCVIAAALLSSSEPLSLDDLIFGVMHEYRPGVDDLAAAMVRADRSAPATDTATRRMRHMMELMTNAGLVVESPARHWLASDLGELAGLAAQAMPKDAAGDIEDLMVLTLLDEPRLQEMLNSLNSTRPQIILAGPPGTSKTFVARALADHLTDKDRDRQKIIQFHPTYSYEDFVEGLRPDPSKDRLVFAPVPGALRRFVNAIVEAGDFDDMTRPYVLLIDEINRANLSRALGELMYLLEYRADGDDLELQYSGEPFRLPRNLLIIGTMNTADRSIRSIDTALRRRFDIFEMPPNMVVLESYYHTHSTSVSDLVEGVEKLNDAIEDVRKDRHHLIGHTFFMEEDFDSEALTRVWNHQVYPLVEEYFFDQPDIAEQFALDGFWRV